MYNVMDKTLNHDTKMNEFFVIGIVEYPEGQTENKLYKMNMTYGM
jgi:hypothetical protein